MKRLIISFLVLLCIVLLSNCVIIESEQEEEKKDFYSPWYEDGAIPEECLLQEGEEPQILYSDDLLNDISLLQSHYYLVIGDYAYIGPANPNLGEDAKALCLEKRAPIGVICLQASDSSTSTVKRYLNSIWLLVPMPKDLIVDCIRIGLNCKNLTETDRLETKRNTGAFVGTVYYDSPAYYSDLFKGDVITELNGITITNADQLNRLFDTYDSTQEIEITYYRDGVAHKTSLTPLY